MTGGGAPAPVNLGARIADLPAHWTPGIVARFNGHEVMAVKVSGDFVWHAHADADDFLLVLSGRLLVDLPDGTVALGPGELLVVPAGVRHRPRAEVETHLLLIEKAGTPNTGDAGTAARKVEF